MKHELAGQKAFLDVSWSSLNNTAITASVDRHIRLYDPRSNGKRNLYFAYSPNLFAPKIRALTILTNAQGAVRIHHISLN
jgi:hypothetical protein